MDAGQKAKEAEVSHLLWQGPSLLGAGSVFAAVSGIDRTSANAKTGAMAQVWYLSADANPFEALKSGEDSSICGNCKLRGDGEGKGRACYVTLLHGPLEVYRQFVEKRMRILEAPPKLFWRGRHVRFGAYGDPACAPTEVTADIAKFAAGHTGYTHQWRTCDQELRRFLMASCDSEEDFHLAHEMGWKTFRVRTADGLLLKGERVCPASEEGGRKLNCLYCGRCKGASGVDTVIAVHGQRGKKHFKVEEGKA